MPYGWRCDACGSVFDSLPKRTRIVVAIYPTPSFQPDMTFCSLACLESHWVELAGFEVWADERREAARV